MIGRIFRGLFLLSAAIAILLGALWATATDPKGNRASFEEDPLETQLAAIADAVTLAQVKRPDGSVSTLLVTDFDQESAEGVDLKALGAASGDDPFAALAAADLSGRGDATTERVAIEKLLPAAGRGDRHLATGTNFPEHAEEASSDAVFNFPKFGAATPARTTLRFRPGGLLDYEVELCMRFDRPIRSAADFDAAVKGVFLCGDFTERATLARLVDPDNLDSGSGFSDAKSGTDFFPSGPFLVIPKDWRAFIAEQRMMTLVNGAPRQDARGGEMTLDFRRLALKVLTDMERPRFLYQGRYEKLAPTPLIGPGMVLMSGTSEGVIFTPPTRADIIEGVVAHLFSGALIRGEAIVPSVIEAFIQNEIASGHFLQPGDEVRFRSSSLGQIIVTVIGDRSG